MTERLFKAGWNLRMGATCWEQRLVAGLLLWCAMRLLEAHIGVDEE